MTPETHLADQQAPQSADADLQPSDYASGFVEGWLRAQGVQGTPTIPEFREALTELAHHLKEVRRTAN
jgi:hypothetical protein